MIVVRWDSALPIRLASKSSPERVAEYYEIFVSGLPINGAMPGGRSRGSGGISDSETLTARLKDKTSLQRKGQDPIFPDRVEMVTTADQEGILFAFPRGTRQIAPAEEMPESPLKLAAPVHPTLRRLSSFDNFRFQGHQRF